MITKRKQAGRRLNAQRSALRNFLKEIVCISGGIDPESVKWVTERILFMVGTGTKSAAAYRIFADQVIEQVWMTSDWEDYRLNKAGFKFYLGVDHKTGLLEGYTGGDQAKDHPDAHLIISMILVKYGFMPKDRINRSYPLAHQFFQDNWKKLKPETREWVMGNLQYVPSSVHIAVANNLFAW